MLDLPELHTSFYACPISSGKFQDSTTYAWRVKVKSSTSEEKLSDVRTFIFCGEKPVEIDTYKVIGVDDRKFDKNLLRLEADTATQTTNDDKTLNGQFLWKDLSGKNEYCGISVEIRKYGQEKWTPYLVGIDETSYEFTNLSYNVTYEVRGQYLKCDCKEAGQPCDTLYAPYSEIKQVRMPSPADTMDCSSGMGTLSECDETAKYPALKVGDTFDANGTTVTIDSIAYPGAPSDSSRISGAGHLSFPILKNIQLKMKFEDITVNCAKQLKKGRVVSVYDLRTCAMLNLEELTGNKNNGGGNNPTADPTVDDSWDGNPSSLSGKNPGDLVCKDGEVTMVGPDKKAVKVGKIVDLPSLNLSLENSSMTHYIRFHNTDEKTQAFDDRRDEIFYCQLISPGDYVPFDGNTDYIIPWVANNPGRVKKIMADESSINSQAEKIDSVKFIIQKDGGKYIQLNHTYDESKKEYMIDVPGISDVAHTTEIYAVGKIGEGSSYKKYGKLMVANYKERNYNLEIVSLTQSLKNSSLNDSYRKAAEESLNAIYGRVGVTFNVQLSEFQDPELEEILKDGVAIGADEQSHWLAETSDMRAIRKAYRKKVGKKDNTAYLFVAQEPEESNYKNVEGDMPVGQAVGYIFMKNTDLNKFGHLVAHEIGHGVFKFQHPFAYKRIKENEKYNRKTNNLMDYNGGEYLGHYQWRAMQDSVGFVWSALQDDEDGMGWFDNFTWLGDLFGTDFTDKAEYAVEGKLGLLSSVKEQCKENTPSIKGFTTILNDSIIEGLINSGTYSVPLNKNQLSKYRISSSFERSKTYTDMIFFSFANKPLLSNYRITEFFDLSSDRAITQVDNTTKKYKNLWNDVDLDIWFIDNDAFDTLCKNNGIDPKPYYETDGKNFECVIMNNIDHKGNGNKVFNDNILGCVIKGNERQMVENEEYAEDMGIKDMTDEQIEEFLKEWNADMRSYTITGMVDYDENNYVCNLNTPRSISAYAPYSSYLAFDVITEEDIENDNCGIVLFGIVTDEHERITEEINLYFDTHPEYSEDAGAFDEKEYPEKMAQMVRTLKMFTYGFILLISIITLANIINTITTSINSRKREFAMVKSVGLDPKGFKKMISLESLFYGIEALLVSIPISVGINIFINKKLEDGRIPFEIDFLMYAIVITAVFLFVGGTMLYSINKIKNDNIIEDLKND